MNAREIEVLIARRFGLARAPTFVARTSVSKHPIIFTHLRSTKAKHRRSMDVPREQSFSFQVPLHTSFPWQAWFSGKQRIVSPATPGNVYLFDLTKNPTVALDTPFNTVRLDLARLRPARTDLKWKSFTSRRDRVRSSGAMAGSKRPCASGDGRYCAGLLVSDSS